MAATTTTISASFSKSTIKLKCTSHSQSPLLKTSSKPSLQLGLLAHNALTIEPIIRYRLRVPSLSATNVAQDNVVSTGEDQSGVAAEENTKLYFGNLPYNVDSAQLAGIIQDHGSPELIEVLYDKNTGRSRGFAFVTMSSVEDATSVIQNLDGTEFGGRLLRVNFSDKPKPKEPLYPETEHKLFVGNLSWSVTSESLKQVFQEYGNVVGARVLFDGETGRSRGYGFVSYPTQIEMENALASLDGVELEGRAIRVSLAQGKV